LCGGAVALACFIDLEKAYDRVPQDKFWRVLQGCDIDGQLLLAIKSFYCKPEIFVHFNSKN